MILKDVKKALIKYKSLSIAEISQITGESYIDLKPILLEWEKKGRINKEIELPFCASSNCGCNMDSKQSCSESSIKYKWNIK